MYQQPQRIDYFDSLRGLAALAVLLGHSFIFQWPPAVAKWASFPILHLAVDGRAAVAMFFVLSGFVLSRPYFMALAGGSAPENLSADFLCPPDHSHLATLVVCLRFERGGPGDHFSRVVNHPSDQ